MTDPAHETLSSPLAAVIGAGPAGLMAAEVLASAGVRVAVHDHMPSVGRKFLMAGRGGLNLTHGEPLERLLTRYRPSSPPLLEAIRAFPPAKVIAWSEGLGIETFEGSSGRIFPRCLKASPLLRAWLARLASLGVTIHPRSRWTGWSAEGGPSFMEQVAATPQATILALGGASWPRLGSDGLWPASLPSRSVRRWEPANMGLEIAWSAHFSSRHEGTPLKRIALTFEGVRVQGEAMVTRHGLEGGAVYALAAPVREAIAGHGSANLVLDLRPDLSAKEVAARLAGRPRAESLANGLRKALALPPVAIGLVQEGLRAGGAGIAPMVLVKALPLRATGVAPLARAISSAGGLCWSELDAGFMLKNQPGVFACGEMLDWEAPTGGYLLQGCLSTGVAAGRSALAWLRRGA
ncbi:TIGR03862 family flavoprotein [Falsiroseomonas selenitidurans]|uniref:TIGR03862 family flavoprotein n=1 Tax=Falsiroseomonas selenitidurans TaxID=2716335 RepID=A0ABX1E1A3_9PROT|nr:TIGR03862 family flavoprotein [Falsiroseomonas selenitidurans]NKC30939.1 TIGR03862 family flavoprotein [Falsiroseomonas selenitidurans]